MRTIASIFFALGGLLAGYVLMGLAAAVGKWLCGLILRFRFEKMTLYMFEFSKKNKKITFGLCDPQPYISCKMFDPKETKIRNMISEALSMAAGIFVCETICIALWGSKVMPNNILTLCMAIMTLVYTVFLMGKFVYTQIKKSGKGGASLLYQAYEKSFAKIKEGTSPSKVIVDEVEHTGKITDASTYRKYLLMKYYHNLDKGDYSAVGKIVDEWEDYVPDKWPHGDVPVLAELLFYYIIISPNEARARFFAKEFLEKMDNTLPCKRVFAYWLFFMENDRGAALQIAMEGMKMVSTYAVYGCQEMEERFITALIRRIETSDTK